MATKGLVKGIVSNLVTVEADGPVSQNEICFITTGGTKLMAEVIKVTGKHAFVQVFESTRGLKVDAEVEFAGHMLEVTLGPGMLSRNYDGLQNDLDKMDGVFLKRGDYTFPLDEEKLWHYKPIAKVGDKVKAADFLGEVEENFQPLKMMVPFTFEGIYTVKSVIEENKAKIEELEQKLAALGKSNRTLNNTLARLQTKLEEKEAILVELQKELENKNIKIDELTKDVANLNETLQNTIAQATEYATKQQQQISEQDANLHKVYYVVGTKKEIGRAHV